MSLNLHGIVRGAIQAVNADVSASYLQSTGWTENSAGKPIPTYAAAVDVQVQVQPPSGRDLQHINLLNLQGVIRSVWLFSDPQAINRVNARGGDLLQFAQFAGAPVDNWLVAAVDETWNVTGGGWSKLYCVLQTDRPS